MSCCCIAFWFDEPSVSKQTGIASYCDGFQSVRLLSDVLERDLCALIVIYCQRSLTFNADVKSSDIKVMFQTQYLSMVSQLGQIPKRKEKKAEVNHK